MDRKTQMDIDYDDELYDEDGDYDAPPESDLQYSDEMSRQAVGKLFAGGGKNDNAGGQLVRGFREGAAEKPARPQARPIRQVPASLSDSDSPQMDKAREIRVVERGRPRRESATTRITQPESQNDVYRSGAREAARATAANVRSRPVEQPRQRDPDATEFIAPTIQDPPRARPARNAGAADQAARPASRPQTAQPEDDSLDLDGFRQRYNPSEMISPPRTKNRPVRGQQGSPQREVRKERVSISDRDLETINSFRLVIVGSCILVVLLIGFLSVRVMMLANQRNAALEDVEAMRIHQETNRTLNYELETARAYLATAEMDRDRFMNVIRENYDLFYHYNRPTGLPTVGGINDDDDEGGIGLPGLDLGTPPTPLQPVRLQPVIPPGEYLNHLIEPGESLASIALIYWYHHPETPDGRRVRTALIQHLVDTNDIIRDPSHIEAGWWIRIYEHPHIPQAWGN